MDIMCLIFFDMMVCCVIEAILMRTHNIPFSILRKIP